MRKKIGVVFQDTTIDNQLTAYENLYIHGGIYGYGGDELKKKIEKLLKFVDLDQYKNKIVKTFSGGMIRRLKIARSLVHEPEILFLDEPTLGLDPQTISHIWEYIRKVKEEHNMAIFLTTHYMDEAELLADRVAIIDHGKIIVIRKPTDLKRKVGNDVIYVRFAGKSGCIDEDFIDYCKELPDGRIETGVRDATIALPKIFEISNEMGLKIQEIEYRKPTLNDVFLHFTGREIRDEGETNNNLYMKRRWRMRR